MITITCLMGVAVSSSREGALLDSGAANALPIANWNTVAEIIPVRIVRNAVDANCFAFILPPGQGTRPRRQEHKLAAISGRYLPVERSVNKPLPIAPVLCRFDIVAMKNYLRRTSPVDELFAWP